MANVLQRILDAVKNTKSTYPGIMSGGVADPFAMWSSGSKSVNPAVAMRSYSGWTYSCVRAIAEAVSVIDYKLLKQKKDGTSEEIFEHELLDLLYGVNERMTGGELWYTIAAHLEVVGNAYILLNAANGEPVKTDTEAPASVYILNPANVTVKRNNNVFPNAVTAYVLIDHGRQYTFAPEAILHFKTPDPSDPIEGIGTVQAIAQWIDADNYAMEFNRRFFLNGARIGGFIESTAASTPEQLTYLTKSFRNASQGVENAYKVLALPSGTSFKPGDATQKDMDFVKGMDMMRDRILAGHRVPRTALGITDDVNRANAEATNYVFALRTIKPKMKNIVDTLNEFLVPRFGIDIVLDFHDPVPENKELELLELQAAMGTGRIQPTMTVNEARERYYGLAAIPGGDEIMQEVSMIPLGTPLEMRPQPNPVPTTPPKSGGPLRLSRYARAAKARKSIATAFAERVEAGLVALEAKAKDIAERVKKDAATLATLTDDEYEVVYKRFAARVTPYEEKVAEAIQRVNAKLSTMVHDNLARATKAKRGRKALDPDELFSQDQALTITVDQVRPIMASLYAEEGAAAAALVGFESFTITERVTAAIDRAVSLLADSYTNTTRDLLAQTIRQGISDGLGIQELAGKVDDVFAFSDQTRAFQVARTETFRIANEATREGWKQSGTVKSVKWYTAADERVCEFCGPLHGKVIGIDEKFYNKGDEVEGADGGTMVLEYDHVQDPPLHVLCRCYTRPELISID